MHRRPLVPLTACLLLGGIPAAAGAADAPMPRAAEGWTVEKIVEAPAILFPTAVVAAADGTVYLGQDPMDMPGPPTSPIDSVVAVKGGKVTVFADRLWAVMGLEWADGTLYVVHAPYLSAFRDTNGDGKADERVDLVTGLGPKLPGFSGINDHVASGVRLGMDGFLYVSVGDKGIPRAVGRDGATIRLFGGGVVRVRPDGSGLEVVSTGERNPLSVALSATDEIFTYGNDDDSKRWPNSLTHHTVGAHFGYPYEFLTAPWRTLPIMDGQLGGSGTQGVCYNEDGLPSEYRGNLFFCDWGLQTVFRYKIQKSGGTYKVTSRTPFVTKGDVDDFRPFSFAVAPDGASFYLVDWAYMGWLADGPKTGRLYRVSYTGADKPAAVPRPTASDPPTLIKALDHPSLSVRLGAQRALARLGAVQVAPLTARLRGAGPAAGRMHALWALDAIGTPEARKAVRDALADADPGVRLQAARSVGIRRDRPALAGLGSLLRDADPAVRREAAVAIGRLGDPSAAAGLYAALGDPDAFAGWSVRKAIRALNAWDATLLSAALLDETRREDALRLADESWSVPAVEALGLALAKAESAGVRSKVVATLAGNYQTYPEWSGHWFGTNPLAGQFPQKTRPWAEAGMARVRTALTGSLKDPSPAVRLQAVAGLLTVGRVAAPALRAAVATEADPRTLAAIAEGLGVLGDFPSAPLLGGLVQDPARPMPVRVAALDGLGKLRGPQALTARLALVYDAKAPASLISRALPALGREGVLPPNDLAGFLGHAEPAVRAAALRALTARKEVPAEVEEAVLARLNDPAEDVRRAAVQAAVALKLRQAVPTLIAAANKGETRADATLALTALPDPRALPVYLGAIRDKNPEVRKAGESALVAVRDEVVKDLEREARSGRYDGPQATVLERLLTRFHPVTDWKVIGPFARTTAQVFIGERSIDFARTHSGVEGRRIAWAPRPGDPATGRVVIDDFKGGVGDRGGFGYDTNGSPDMSSFGYAEIDSPVDRSALLLVGSSGTLIMTVNEEPVYAYRNFAGRAYTPDSDVVRVPLKTGKNRVLVQTRQGIGAWSFGVQVSDPSTVAVVASGKAAAPDLAAFRAFALGHDGDPKNGEALFFDAKGVGCVKCHSVGARGTATVGPDLTGLALKYDKAEIVRSVLEPSTRIATGYQPVILATTDGKVLSGVVKSETDDAVELVDSEARVTRVAKSDIDERKVGEVSVMPAGQVDALTVVEFADLVSYLQSLKAPPAPPAK